MFGHSLIILYCATIFSTWRDSFMSLKRVLNFLLPLTLLSALLLAACGGTSTTSTTANAPVTLTYWYTEGTAEAPVILSQIKAFEQQNPNIKINAQLVPFGD